MNYRLRILLIVPLLLATVFVSGCSRPKIVSVSRQQSMVAQVGNSEYRTYWAEVGYALLIVVFDTGQKDGIPPFTLTDEEGAEYLMRGQIWNQSMGSKVKVWWDVPTNKTRFILKSEDKTYAITIDTTK